MVETAKVAVVTIITAYELEDRLMSELRDLGVVAYTVGKVDGRGAHGLRTAGIFEAANLRFELVVAPSVAQTLAARIDRKFADRPIIAYFYEVEAVPRARFS